MRAQEKEASASLSAARWLVGITAAIALAFVLSTAISEYVESAVSARTSEMISDEMPSIQLLAHTRGDLRRLESEVDQFENASAAARPGIARRMDAFRDGVAEDLRSYATLPLPGQQRTLSQRSQETLDRMRRDLAQLETDSSPALLAALHRDLDVLDEWIERITTFDATQGQRLGQEIERIRRQARGTTVLLDAMSVALAVLASVLAVRQLQRAARGQDAALRLRDRREAELASQNEALGDFAGRVAHDILSPLATAMLSFEMIRQTTADPPVVTKVERGASAIARVHTLVDDLLTFSRAGGRPEPGASAPLGPVLTDLVAELRTQAQQQDIALELGPVPEGRVACSEGALTSMVSNLVRNAIKYMGTGSIRTIAVRVQDNDRCWRFDIEDSGPGIPVADHLRIFEPYVQLDRSASGIGLGLATVDRLVRAHGGRVGVTSPVIAGRGSLFWFELPKASSDDPALAISAHPRCG